MRLIKYQELEVGKFYLWYRVGSVASFWTYNNRACFLFRCMKYRQSYDERLWYELLTETTSFETPRMMYKEEGLIGSEWDISLSKFRDEDYDEDLYLFELSEDEVLNQLVVDAL